MFDLLLVGYGPAHMALLLALSQKHNLKVAIADPYFDGGDLFRTWGTIQSNTTWQQFIDAVSPYCSAARVAALKAEQDADKTTCLSQLVRHLKEICESCARPERFYGLVASADWCIGVNSASVAHSAPQSSHLLQSERQIGGHWTATLADGRKVEAKVLSLAPGAEPKKLQYPKPQLTLESVLSPGLPLKVCRGDHVVVFGLSHSGTLAVDALLKCGASLSVVYNTAKPFLYNRDGAYGGIKQESAAIADRLTENPDLIQLIRGEETSKLLSALIQADWVVYAVGFERRSAPQLSVNQIATDKLTYDVATGIASTPNTFVWGIAYPSATVSEGQQYYDVSLPAFIAHAEKNVAAVLDSATKTS